MTPARAARLAPLLDLPAEPVTDLADPAAREALTAAEVLVTGSRGPALPADLPNLRAVFHTAGTVRTLIPDQLFDPRRPGRHRRRLGRRAAYRPDRRGPRRHRPEPLPPDSPYWTLPNVLLTPHHASAYNPVEAGAARPGARRSGSLPARRPAPARAAARAYTA